MYSLWLMPRGRIAEELQKLIADLSMKYKTPVFQPHVTLIGELNLPKARAVNRTKELVDRITPFEIRLAEVSYLEEYFRCIFINARKTRDLTNAHETACELFRQRSHEDYMPHLSLIYGHLSSRTKQIIIQEIGDKIEMEFLTSEIHLYYTGGDPEGWYKVAEMQFGCHRL